MKLVAAVLLVAGIAAANPAAADQQIYRYRVEHRTYGDIGTYTNFVRKNGDVTDVKSELHVAVKFLGLVMYRQDASRTERWQGDRLIYFHGVTVTNGAALEVTGKAQGDRFAVTTPQGTMLAPANVKPSNPWSAMILDSNLEMSTRTGKLIPVRVSRDGEQNVTLDGVVFRLHQYEIFGDKHEFVWLDNDGLPVAFQTEERGAPINFVLTRDVAQNHYGPPSNQ